MYHLLQRLERLIAHIHAQFTPDHFFQCCILKVLEAAQHTESVKAESEDDDDHRSCAAQFNVQCLDFYLSHFRLTLLGWHLGTRPSSSSIRVGEDSTPWIFFGGSLYCGAELPLIPNPGPF